MANLAEIRSTFLNYFSRNDHQLVASSPLVPRNDPTLMFANSGMVQFKNLFTGQETRDYKRATTSQKCVRAGGKHNDLDNVGYTARHLTFFEMLGNFSFGDYFKEQAISHAWQVVTNELDIPKDKLLVTVYHTDDEAAELWKKIAGLSDDKIIRIASNDNFWMMGPTGPCGPSSEIFYDYGDKFWGGPPGSPEEDGDRFIEIWNLVFMQNEQFEDGSMRELDMQSIDTGMGLERISALLQGTNNVFETDLMRALVDASADATSSDTSEDLIAHHRVIADHLRSAAFLVAEGVFPSNEGRGYVLRRIMRRAMRHAHLLGAKDPVMHRLVPELVKQMGGAYPELNETQATIEDTLLTEELRFRQTLDRGLKLLDTAADSLDDQGRLPGETAFKLYDTYGFPLDLTQDALRDRGIAVDTDGFDAAMAEQKAKARASWSGSGDAAQNQIWFDVADAHGSTDFLGYETEKAEAQLLALVNEAGEMVKTLAPGETGTAVFNQTPFYGESGGQVGDTGNVTSDTGWARVLDTQKAQGVFLHKIEVERGTLEVGQGCTLEVDHGRRSRVRANHSATHLLHEALRERLGDHVMQRGSLNDEMRLRFDFSHPKALTADQLSEVEADVNGQIRGNSPVVTRLMGVAEAKQEGALALFGEKYGEEVRVVSMGHKPGAGKGRNNDIYSVELCGGTHVKRTGDIGTFVIVSDGASSAGIRRIEALTGQAAVDYLRGHEAALGAAAAVLKVGQQDVADRVQSLMNERKALANEVAQLRRELAMGGGAAQEEGPEQVNGVAFTGKVLSGLPGKDLPGMIDQMKEQMGSGVVVLISDLGGKAAIAAGVTADLTERVSAVDVLRAAVSALGGKGGGGRPDMAQGGAGSAENSAEAIAAARAVLEG